MPTDLTARLEDLGTCPSCGGDTNATHPGTSRRCGHGIALRHHCCACHRGVVPGTPPRAP